MFGSEIIIIIVIPVFFFEAVSGTDLSVVQDGKEQR